MTTERMTVLEALDELKLLDARINKEIGSAQFSTYNKHSNVRFNGKTIDEFKGNAKASFDKITMLLKRRDAIKRAVVLSNAITKVTIAGEEMTVAEAIDRRDYGNDLRQYFVNQISSQYEAAKNTIARENGSNLTARADDYVVRLYGNAEKSGNTDVTSNARKTYIEANTLDLIDPIDSEKVIKQLTEEIDTFTSKVKSALTASNAQTVIEITY